MRKLGIHTSSGYQILQWWKSALDWTPMPWQRWVTIRAHELNPNGTLRFREILVVVARQSGKTTLITYLGLYWLAHGIPLVLGTSSSLDTAREGWETACDIAEDNPSVFGTVKIRRSNGDWQLTTANRSRYKVSSASRRGGRGLTVHRLIEDELREHLDWEAHSAASNSTVAVPNSQVWMCSNAGDDRSIVLAHYRALALTNTISTLGLFEWSAPDGCEIDDREAWAQANPSLGITITEESLLAKSTQPASVFRTENLAQTVPSLDEAVSPDAWSQCLDPGTLENHRKSVVLCLDISPDLRHATLVAAAPLPDGRVRIEVVNAWTSTSVLRAELPELLKRIKPRAFGWFPGGPSAALALELGELGRSQEIPSQATSAACMGLAEFIGAGRIAQSGDELLAAHILGAKKRSVGDGWVFSRRDGGQCDAAFAAAGAVHLARSLPKPARLRVITAAADGNSDGQT